MTDALRLMVRVLPHLGFADVTSTEDHVQKYWFEITGGRDDDCCIDGCRCDRPHPHGVRGGRLDWTKTRKVAVLQRQHRAHNNYRSFIHEGANHFLLLHNQLYTSSGLRTWLHQFAVSTITLQNRVSPTTGRTYTDVTTTLPASSTCSGCLDQVLGQEAVSEKCRMSWGNGENFYTVAAMYNTDWMTLWSLNGGDAPDVAQMGTQYRFAHEYHVRAGETMESIAERFGTTVEHLLHLNENLITNIHNPRRVMAGDVICLVPGFHHTMDQMGLPICPSDRQKNRRNRQRGARCGSDAARWASTPSGKNADNGRGVYHALKRGRQQR
jgi:hypothetical protein